MVRCANCGLLAFREKATGDFCEADIHQRKYTDIRINRGYEVFDRIPVCIEHVVDFCKDLKEKPGETVHPDKILPLIEAERECEMFTPYKRGRSPQWHQDMNTQIELQRLQDAQREKERRWQDDQKAADRKWQEEQTAANRRWQIKLACLAAIFSLITGAIGICLGKLMNPPTPPVQPIINITTPKDGAKVEMPDPK